MIEPPVLIVLVVIAIGAIVWWRASANQRERRDIQRRAVR